MRSLAREVARRGITVNCVSPGFCETELLADLPEDVRKKHVDSVPLRRFARPEEIAYAVRCLASREATYLKPPIGGQPAENLQDQRWAQDGPGAVVGGAGLTWDLLERHRHTQPWTLSVLYRRAWAGRGPRHDVCFDVTVPLATFFGSPKNPP